MVVEAIRDDSDVDGEGELRNGRVSREGRVEARQLQQDCQDSSRRKDRRIGVDMRKLFTNL